MSTKNLMEHPIDYGLKIDLIKPVKSGHKYYAEK